jgi:hypothetical protein
MSRRHESTARRHTKRLQVPPTPSYQNASVAQDHIIFNPPSSAPNVQHTPVIFLPKSDKRRKVYEDALAQAEEASAPPNTAFAAIAQTGTPLSVSSTTLTASSTPLIAASRAVLPPPLKPVLEKKYHVTEEQIEEIRRLRAQDPRKWTRYSLAEKFHCSPFFIGLVSRAPLEIRDDQRRALEEIKKRWGRKKTEAREDRARRKELWGREA